MSPGSIAAIILGVLLGFAALTVLSLLWMAARVRWCGAFGRKSSAVLRSVYPVVLGLGGWFIGVLIVITTMPGVPIDDELLAVLSVGVPVGLGIHLAWVDRGSPPPLRVVGLAAAVAGGLVGAWLGFHATADMLALGTAIVAAVAGANLLLILLDLTWERPVGSGFARDAVASSTLRHGRADRAAALPRT